MLQFFNFKWFGIRNFIQLTFELTRRKDTILNIYNLLFFLRALVKTNKNLIQTLKKSYFDCLVEGENETTSFDNCICDQSITFY